MKIPKPAFYKYFEDGMPWYLVRHYWWAYLWPVAVWFFDHQPIINAILFGQYRKLMDATMARLAHRPKGRVLQLTCVYGELTPKLAAALHPEPLHITDVAQIQLDVARRKLGHSDQLMATRMNAEHLGYEDDSFSTIVLFFLLHEMPEEARRNTLAECMRTLVPGGVLLMTEYAPRPQRHLLYRFPPSRWLLVRLEPFLGTFWLEDMEPLLNECGSAHGKHVAAIREETFFSDFYRVTEFSIAGKS
ncbi:MAG: class I SAM-dependent methyltransferase [Rhodospirillaceae bacterium]|nr:class I SAM-dependent methyltransferase [Rhodospirillaceae bacterium]